MGNGLVINHSSTLAESPTSSKPTPVLSAVSTTQTHGPIPFAAELLGIDHSQYAIWIRTFGRLRVYVDYREIPSKEWRYPKVQSLLRFLLLHPGNVPLDQVLETIWPDLPPERARQNFAVALHHLRKAVEPDKDKPHRSQLILYKDKQVRLDHSSILTDRNLFLKLWAHVQKAGLLPEEQQPFLMALTSLYAGPLYEDEPYEDWCAVERQRLSDIYVLAREALARLAFEANNLNLCVQHCQEVLVVEPLHEPAHLLLLQAYQVMGHRARAVTHYHQLRKQLDDELGVPPSEPIRQLYEEILNT